MRFLDQRRAPRPSSRHDRLPAPHAILQGRRNLDPRAVARRAFPIIKDLVVDRSAFDRIIQAGGYICPDRQRPRANAILVTKEAAETAMDAAACIGCGACVAACPNASAMLFTAAKITHLNVLPQGQPERDERTLNMVAAMDREEFGSCTNHAECEAACPKEIPLEFIAQLNRDLLRADFPAPPRAAGRPWRFAASLRRGSIRCASRPYRTFRCPHRKPMRPGPTQAMG